MIGGEIHPQDVLIRFLLSLCLCLSLSLSLSHTHTHSPCMCLCDRSLAPSSRHTGSLRLEGGCLHLPVGRACVQIKHPVALSGLRRQSPVEWRIKPHPLQQGGACCSISPILLRLLQRCVCPALASSADSALRQAKAPRCASIQTEASRSQYRAIMK